MSQFQVTILGCGSAMPTTLHNPPSQLVNMNGKLFMIDCEEGDATPNAASSRHG